MIINLRFVTYIDDTETVHELLSMYEKESKKRDGRGNRAVQDQTGDNKNDDGDGDTKKGAGRKKWRVRELICGIRALQCKTKTNIPELLEAGMFHVFSVLQ